MTLEEIKSTYSMYDIVSGYGIKINRFNKIICPFHNEKTPSFTMTTKKFKCHGCGEYGDIIDFVMKYENISFSDAFEKLGGTHSHDDESKQATHELILKRKKGYTIIENLENKAKEIDQFIDDLRDRSRRQEPLSWTWTYYINMMFYENLKIDYINEKIKKIRGSINECC